MQLKEIVHLQMAILLIYSPSCHYNSIILQWNTQKEIFRSHSCALS